MIGDTKQVFLVSGQLVTHGASGEELVSALIEQQVVVAVDGQAAYAALAKKMPNFRPVGLTSLDDYERAVAKIKATLKGAETGWALLIAPGMIA